MSNLDTTYEVELQKAVGTECHEATVRFPDLFLAVAGIDPSDEEGIKNYAIGVADDQDMWEYLCEIPSHKLHRATPGEVELLSIQES